MKDLTKLMQAQFDKMCATKKLYKSSISGAIIWKTYLNKFSPEDNPVFRDPESSEHNCNLCNNFIRRYGNIVAMDSTGIITIFDVIPPEEYKRGFKIISNALKDAEIANVFFETYDSLQSLPYESCKKTQEHFQLGTIKNVKRYTQEEADKYGVVKKNEIRTFHHFHLSLPKAFVDMSGKSIESIQAHYRDKFSVFKRAMEEISVDTLNLVKDLIQQGSLLDGTAHLHSVMEMISFKQFLGLAGRSITDQDYWGLTYGLEERTAKFRNTLIGVLCVELTEGMELNKACENWNKRVDPANYMKAVAPITKAQIAEAKKFVEENEYEESFDRRFATIDDIKVSEILHSNASNEIKKVSIFDDVKSTSTRHKRSEFDKVEEVTIDKFMKDILPTCTSVEAFLTNSQQGNFVSLTTANTPDSKPIFKWNNNYSWTFAGNLAGKSQLKEAVKSAGGKVDGVLRFSIMWAEQDGDNSDLDAHCYEPDGSHIYYSTKSSRTGSLDIDIQNPMSEMPKGAVENIIYPSLTNMKDGQYIFSINQYSDSNSKGFKAEIEFNGEIFSYMSNSPVKGKVQIAVVTLKNGEFSIKHSAFLHDSNVQSKEIYGLESNQFHKVNLVCLSPNHWGENNVGNKHVFFMLQDCKSSTEIRTFHNENLTPELAKHRKVLETLGNTTMIESTDKQLSGLGFNHTVKDELVVKVKGSHQRVIKIKFNQ